MTSRKHSSVRSALIVMALIVSLCGVATPVVNAAAAPAPNPAKALFGPFEDQGYLQGGTEPVWMDQAQSVARLFIPMEGKVLDAEDKDTIEVAAWAFFPSKSELEAAKVVLCQNGSIPEVTEVPTSRRTMMIFGYHRPAEMDPAEPKGTYAANLVEENEEGKIEDLAFIVFRPTGRKDTYNVIVSALTDQDSKATEVHMKAAASFKMLAKCVTVSSLRLTTAQGSAASQKKAYLYERPLIKSGANSCKPAKPVAK